MLEKNERKKINVNSSGPVDQPSIKVAGQYPLRMLVWGDSVSK